MASSPLKPSKCTFLDLPVELRLEIYAHAILNCRHITIGTAKIVGAPADIVHRLYALGRSPYPGIPRNHEPVVDTQYAPALLSAVADTTVDATVEPPESAFPNTRTSFHALSWINKQIKNEIHRHFSIPTQRGTSLWVQYPSGLHILHTTTPQLLRQSRSVHLAGSYTPRHYCPSRVARLGTRHALPQEPLQGKLVPDSEKQLEQLVRSCLGRDLQHSVDLIEMRIYYPGENSYSTVWGDDESPVVVALRNIDRGEIDIEVWRGQQGTGVRLCAKRSPEEDKKRVVSTVWRKLEEGGRGQPETGSWIVDERWPEWVPMDDIAKVADVIASTHTSTDA
ncbi:hypothetical protein CB0940_03177 [Cercospora beticola]|uniref:Uncharacterized protein n=1 Tax=Cercospora beticola TaxID=122368 RepID=A0A2G5I5G5_CERBT|nr:hypothetical protein CB0940_03177 [Cercospora beticola]PIB00056.1 hypothetical protein CB0940_03177 [Cercospora beticola]WPB00347.1 hypothetical protein RHO25_004966 [Cercospora beticola]CAK1361448.1 unnamed protein product [Cercospora beticola]